MLSIFKTLIAVIVLAGVLFAGTAASAQKVKDRFNPDGSFWIQGTPPPEFKDIGGINLNSHRSRRFPAAGVELVSGSRLLFKTLTVKPDSLIFATGALRGISYSFSGRFLKKGVFSAGSLDEDTPVLEGTLTKFRGGRKIGEAKLKFTYFGGT